MQMAMRIIEDTDLGLLAVDPDGDGENTLRFGRMKYDGKRKQYTPDCKLPLQDFCTWPTKAEAQKAARRIGFTAGHVERVGSRFWSCWGIRHDLRDTYFLAIFE